MKENESTDLILLNTGYAIHYANWNYKNVNSPFARIFLIKDGNAKLHLQNHVQNLLPGHLYYIPPFTLHSYECDDYFSLYYIHIYENQLSNKRILEDYIFPVEIKGEELDYLLVNELIAINPAMELKQYNPSDYDNSHALLQSIKSYHKAPLHIMLETKGILFQLVSRFLEYASNKYQTTDSRIIKVLRFIRRNTEKQIKIKELSEMCGLSNDHFIRLFKKEVQTTPIQYINQKKIEKAQLMIAIEQQTIKNVAYALSFENVSYFNRIFKQQTGFTPSMYKDSINNE